MIKGWDEVIRGSRFKSRRGQKKNLNVPNKEPNKLTNSNDDNEQALMYNLTHFQNRHRIFFF